MDNGQEPKKEIQYDFSHMYPKKKPIYKKWWVWLIAFFFFVGAIGSLGDDDAKKEAATSAASTEPQVSTDNSTKSVDEEAKKKEAAAEEKKKTEAAAAAKKKASEDAAVKKKADEAIKNSVLEFEKSVYALENKIKNVMDSYQAALTGLGDGSVDINTAYEAASNAKEASESLQLQFASLEIPDGLPNEAEDLLEESKSDLSTAYYTKKKAIGYVMDYMDDPKPSTMQKFKDEIAMSDSFIMNGIAKIFDAKMKVGIDITKK